MEMAYGKTYTTIDNSKASAASDSTKLPITAGTDMSYAKVIVVAQK